jgi:hypothetical protein
MICRVWRGRTSPDNAGSYEQLLLGTILPGIRARNTPGYLEVRVDRRAIPGAMPEVEFVTTMYFESIDAVIAFAGPEYVVAVVPERARQLLSRFDAVSAHYEVVAVYQYGQDSPADVA